LAYWRGGYIRAYWRNMDGLGLIRQLVCVWRR